MSYDPTIGRWLSEDPIGFEAGDPNLYRYVGNVVTMLIDPDGLKGTGHHLIPWELWAEQGVSKEVFEFFDSDAARIFNDYYTTHNGGTVNGITHYAYSQSVCGELNTFLGGRKVSELTLAEAQQFFEQIKSTSNATIVNFNQGVQAEAFAALEEGKKAFDAYKLKGYTDLDAKKAAIKEAKIAANSTRAIINKRGIRIPMWKKGLAAVPILGYFVCATPALAEGDVNGAGRETFMNLTGMDTPRDVGLILVEGLYEAERQGDEFAQRVRESEKWRFP